MVYVRRAKRSNGYRRPGYKACGRMVMGDARKALTIARGVKRLINVEFKFFDATLTSVEVLSTPQLLQLTNILQGDGGSSRDGNQVKIVGNLLKYTCTMDSAATTSQLRVLLVLDKQTNGVIAAAGDVLEDVTVFDGIISPYNLDNKYRFRILYDKVHLFQASGNRTIQGGKYIKMNERIRYDGVAGTIADITSSSLFLMILSSTGANGPDITFINRVRYVDN